MLGSAGSIASMENATVRFVEATDGRPEGLSALELHATDADRAMTIASKRGLLDKHGNILVCGMRLRVKG